MVKTYDFTIRIHHFFDIIRDFGEISEFLPDKEYKHSYHSIAHKILDDAKVSMKIIIGTDAVCEGCIHNQNSICDDTLDRKPGFNMKDDYNNYLDKRILDKCNVRTGDILTPADLFQVSEIYIQCIDEIYQIDNQEKRNLRKEKFIRGYQKYKDLHNIQ